MKTIMLSKGKVALVDDRDFNRLNQFSWSASYRKTKTGDLWYAARYLPYNRRAYMHREVLGITDPKTDVDHKNNDSLDNRRTNLRRVNKTQNNMNMRKRSGCTSSFKGVSWHAKVGRWYVTICVDGKPKFLGEYAVEEDGARAYNAAAIKYFGKFALLNVIL